MQVCFIYSNRAEYSELEPYINYFKGKVVTKIINLQQKIKNIESDKNLHKIYSLCYEKISRGKYDYVCILADRRELPFIALAAFFLNVKIVHIGAGEYLESVTTYDQFVRPIISILSNFQICFSKTALQQVKNLFSGISYLKPHAYFLGNPVFKGIDIQNLVRPIKENYDMILLHPQSRSRSNTMRDVKRISKLLTKKKIVFIYGNKDKNSDVIEKFYGKLKKENNNYNFLKSLPKKEYFSFVKYCDNFYTNSSSTCEMEYLNKGCVKIIGDRNKNRAPESFNEKSPELLFSILKNDYLKYRTKK